MWGRLGFPGWKEKDALRDSGYSGNSTQSKRTEEDFTSLLTYIETPRSDGADVPSAGCLFREVRDLGMDVMQPKTTCKINPEQIEGSLKEILAVFLQQFRPLSALPECTVISGGLYAKKRQLVRLTYSGRCDLCYNCSLCDYFEGWTTESCRRDMQLYFCNVWNVLCSFQKRSLLFLS